MFVLAKTPTVTVDVPVQVPGADKPSTIKATWKLYSWDDYREIMEQQQKGDKGDEDLLGDLVKLDGIKDEGGNLVEHTKELVEQLMQITYVRRPLILSWFAAQEGRTQAAAKN